MNTDKPVQSFFAALAIPMTTAVALVACVLLVGMRGPLVALLLNTFLLFEIAGFSQVYTLPVPAGYFRLRRIEQPWLYEWLGIRAFKWLMRTRLYRRVNPDFRLTGGRRGLGELTQTMQSAEAAHGLLFVLASAIAGFAILADRLGFAAWLMAFNIPLNAYPVMLQRYNRLRILRAVS